MLQYNILDLFQGIAILVLAGVLVFLWSTINRLCRTVRRLEESIAQAPLSRAPQALPPTPAPAPSLLKTPEPEAIDEGVLTAIAAAVALMVRQPHRIVAIQPDAGAQLAWSAEGRRELYHSHRIR